MEAVILRATRRERLGTRHTRRLRQQGQTPAIIYGHHEDPEAVSLEEHDVELAMQHHTRLIEVSLDGKKAPLLIKAVQYDHLGTTPIHLDLMRVDMDERVRVAVDVELRGDPQGVHEGGVLHQLLNSVEVECLVTAIPESFRPSVAHLTAGASLQVRDIELPPGVTMLTNLEERVATCSIPTAVAEEEVEVEEAEAEEAEPEVIGRARQEDQAKEGS
jgi:large subunit ribosomal protein L25